MQSGSAEGDDATQSHVVQEAMQTTVGALGPLWINCKTQTNQPNKSCADLGGTPPKSMEILRRKEPWQSHLWKAQITEPRCNCASPVQLAAEI